MILILKDYLSNIDKVLMRNILIQSQRMLQLKKWWVRPEKGASLRLNRAKKRHQRWIREKQTNPKKQEENHKLK